MRQECRSGFHPPAMAPMMKNGSSPLAISLGRKFLKTTILENNIIQTTGSAGESIASGVAFTLPGFLFLTSPDSASYFNYLTILILAIVGAGIAVAAGALGTAISTAVDNAAKAISGTTT